MPRTCLALLVLVAVLAGCDRRIEPYVEGEQPRQPDLSHIFPAGAEQAEQQAQAPRMPPAPGARAAPASGPPIRGTVEVAPELASRVRDGAVLFVIARVGASGPPLAVKRIAAPHLPLDFELGPDDRMIQAMPFAGSLRVMARLDSDGNAMTRTPGDLQGVAEGTYEPGATGIRVVLDEVI